MGLALRLPTFALTRPSRHFLRAAVSLSPNAFLSSCDGLSRRGELHPPALVVAQRALLEALRFSRLADLAGLPGTSVPHGLRIEGLAPLNTRMGGGIPWWQHHPTGLPQSDQAVLAGILISLATALPNSFYMR